MAEALDINNYMTTLQQVLDAKQDWLEKSEMSKLKEDLRMFHSSFASLYNIYLKKKLIDEDPYKQESKITEIEVPDSSNFQEAKRIEALTIRLANYDNQLDFLVNFYQLGIDFLNLDRIKRIAGLVRYIDWTGFSPDSQSIMTKAVALLTNQSKAGVDPLTLSIIGESLSRLNKSTHSIMKTIKELSTYYRERYKLNVRLNISKDMSSGEATPENIRKKMPSALPGTPYYKELIEEIIKEDYTDSGTDLRDTILNSLKVKESKPKAAKPAINLKNILLDGIQTLGGASNILTDILSKFDENHAVLENRKKTFFEALKELIRKMTNAEPEEVIYQVEYMDATKGIPVKEKVSFHQFRDDLEKKVRILSSFVKGSAYQKISAMNEDQITGYLERYINDLQNIHKTLGALDDYFKANAAQTDREKIKGIKPDLTALKNIYVRANQMRYEYSAQKEEEEQMRRLGVTPVGGAPVLPASDAPPPPPPA